MEKCCMKLQNARPVSQGREQATLSIKPVKKSVRDSIELGIGGAKMEMLRRMQ